MKKIKNLRLPKWAIYKLPFNEEDDAFGAFIVPFVLFPLVGTGFAWLEFHAQGRILTEIIIVAVWVTFILEIAWWLFLQVELLKERRRDLMFDYKLAKEYEEKEKIKLKLESLLSKVDYLKFLYEVEKNSKEKEEIKKELKELLSTIDYLKFLYETEKNPIKKEEIREKLKKLDVFVK